MYARDTAVVATPIGRVALCGDDACLHGIRIGVDDATAPGTVAEVRYAADQLAAWFAGDRTTFDLRLAAAATARGGTLRAAIATVGYGATASYGELARAHASSARAVGQACARNPFPLVIPCHRVLAAGGVLGPYSAGDGPATKRWLLDFESRATRLL
jgi:methylated-DNA-[protein]-cysteine S-methyltransferase